MTVQNVSRFRKIFTNKHVVLPVIHVTSDEQARRNAEIAKHAGADGVFLINHAVSSRDLLTIQEQVWEVYPDWWIGVNCLDLSPSEVFGRVSGRIAGIWADNAMIDESQEKQLEAEAVLEAKQTSGWKGLYFGGVAFKYQRPVKDLAQAACRASRYTDVVTTSGPGTGRAADVEKIRAMKAALDDFPLAIASGITPENVEEYLPYTDCLLVATGISDSFEELNPEKLRTLVTTVRAWAQKRESSNDHSCRSLPISSSRGGTSVAPREETTGFIYSGPFRNVQTAAQTMQIGRHQVSLFPGPSAFCPVECFFPPLVHSSEGVPGKFYTYDHKEFHPGFPWDHEGYEFHDSSPGQHQVHDRICLFIDSSPDELRRSLSSWFPDSCRYAVFFQRSAAPWEEGFVTRIRLMTEEKVRQRYHLTLELESSLQQPCTMADLAGEFSLSGAGDEEYMETLYGSYRHWNCADGYGHGLGVFREANGVIRLWHRVRWVPK